MKKNLLSVALVIIFYGTAPAQDWKLTGNSNATSTSILGTLNSNPLRFFTDNKLRMQITSEGKVVIGGSSSSNSALFEVISTNRGVLFPRMTGTQRNAISSPAQGLLVYQKDGTKGFYYYDAGWKQLGSGGSGFANTALSNLTSTSINKDLVPNANATRNLGSSPLGWKNIYMEGSVYVASHRFLNGFGTNTYTGFDAGIHNFGGEITAYGYVALYSNTSGINNTAVGAHALYSNTLGNFNTAVGTQALVSNIDGNDNTAVGRSALFNNGSGISNTAVGVESLLNNTSGNFNTAYGSQSLSSNTTGVFNTAQGAESLFSNNAGNFNTANGYQALFSNTTGNFNTADGYQALYSDTTGEGNTAQGTGALYSNTIGEFNSGHGFQALFLNTEGINNSAHGTQALYSNTTGGSNTASGFQSLFTNSTGYGNAAVGRGALIYNPDGNYNTGIGYFAGDNAVTYNGATFLGSGATTVDGLGNVTAVGEGAITTASNTVWLGNASVTDVMTSGNFTTTSDGRFKQDIKEEVPGLIFINQLRPVTYHYNIHELNNYLKQDRKSVPIAGGTRDMKEIKAGQALKPAEAAKIDEEVAATTKARETEGIRAKEAIKYTGFVAQEVEAAAKKLNYDFSGVHKPANDKDVYGLSYAEFVVPLVKAVQELSKINDEQQKQIDDLKAMVLKLSGHNTTVTASGTALSSAYLEQSTPNPSNRDAVIKYYVPNTAVIASLVFTDMKGNIIKSVPVSKGKGQVIINSNSLTSGIYNYSLYVDNALTDTKQMVIGR